MALDDGAPRRINRPLAKMLSQAMEEAGIKESVRLRKVGLYRLARLLDEGDHFQDWLGEHLELSGVQRRIRVYLTYGKPGEEAKRLQRVASLELQSLEGIEHPGILRALDYQQHDHGPALVYDYDPVAERLDHYLLRKTPGQPLALDIALPLLRDIAEAVRHAHARRLYHRALYEMATGILPAWSDGEGMPVLLEGELEIDTGKFDPILREPMAAFFRQALARDVKRRFDDAEDMRRAWRQLFLAAARPASHVEPEPTPSPATLGQVQLDTQVGLLDLSPQALDTLGRQGINRVDELLRLPLNELARMTGVGTNTRRELSALVRALRERFPLPPQPEQAATAHPGRGGSDSIDLVFRQIFPARTPDPRRKRFLVEFLGRLDRPQAPLGIDNVFWPSLTALCGELAQTRDVVQDLLDRLVAQWSRLPAVTALRHDLAELLADNGGVMTATELAEALLLRRGSTQESPWRERWAQAVLRAGVETELARQDPRWILRRSGKRVLIADNRTGDGEEWADYADSLGRMADECAEQDPLLPPIRVLEKVRAIAPPETFGELGNHRLLRLAAAASQRAALSSRAELYPRRMPARRALQLGQGALLGARILTVREVQGRVQGRYPEAEPLPGRPELDTWIQELDIGFEWDPEYRRNGDRGAYRLPLRGDSTLVGASTHLTTASAHGAEQKLAAQGDEQTFRREVTTAVAERRFLALTVKPRQMAAAAERLAADIGLAPISFDALLLRHVHRACDAMATPPQWDLVLRADAADPDSRDRQNLLRLVGRALPGMADELLASRAPVLLTVMRER
jgi:hypothetical protein